MNGCLPQSANTLAEAEGGSGARVTLRHGSQELDLDLHSASALPSLLCDAVVTACTHTTDRREGEGWRGAMHFSLRVRQLCTTMGFPAHCKENISEQPLHELPQKVGEDVFSALVILLFLIFEPGPFRHCSFL